MDCTTHATVVSTPLAYTAEIYQSIYKASSLASFSHKRLREGDIDKDKALETIAKLNFNCKSSPIHFQDCKLEDRLNGGACSAISFRIAKAALEAFEKPDFKEIMLKIVKDLNLLGTKENSTCKNERTLIRTVQAAFNTIVCEQTNLEVDFSQEKIKAMASLFSMTVVFSTKELKAENSSLSLELFNKTIQSLPRGIYLMRIIKLENNHKLEFHGHSVVYIKHTPGPNLYFDPQLGFYDVEDPSRLVWRA